MSIIVSSFYDRFTLEAFSRDGQPLGEEIRVRRALLASRVRAHVTGRDRNQADPARDGWRLFREALTAVPKLPGELEIGTIKVKVGEIRTWQQTQVVSFSGQLLVD